MSALTRALIETRGHFAPRDIDAFVNAGFGYDHVLEVIAGLATSVMADYAANITAPPLEDPFKAQAWSR